MVEIGGIAMVANIYFRGTGARYFFGFRIGYIDSSVSGSIVLPMTLHNMSSSISEKVSGFRWLAMLVGLFLAGCVTTGPTAAPEENGDETEEVREVEEEAEWDPAEEIRILDVGERYVFGWVEWVCVLPQGLQIKAKLDSGARTSSMNALDLTEFERDGDDWVRFNIEHPKTGELVEIERPVSRWLRIVQHEDDPRRRPVVKMEVKLGQIHQEVEFSLADRSNFVYQILIGRNYLRGLGLIDSDATFLGGHPCAE